MDGNEASEIGSETEGTDNENKLGLRDFLGFDESLDGFKEDGETECDKEDAVYESTEGFCALPLSYCQCQTGRTQGCFLLRMCISWSWSSRSRP